MTTAKTLYGELTLRRTCSPNREGRDWTARRARDFIDSQLAASYYDEVVE